MIHDPADPGNIVLFDHLFSIEEKILADIKAISGLTRILLNFIEGSNNTATPNLNELLRKKIQKFKLDTENDQFAYSNKNFPITKRIAFELKTQGILPYSHCDDIRDSTRYFECSNELPEKFFDIWKLVLAKDWDEIFKIQTSNRIFTDTKTFDPNCFEDVEKQFDSCSGHETDKLLKNNFLLHQCFRLMFDASDSYVQAYSPDNQNQDMVQEEDLSVEFLLKCLKISSGRGWPNDFSAKFKSLVATLFEHATDAEIKQLSKIILHMPISIYWTLSRRRQIETYGMVMIVPLFENLPASTCLKCFVRMILDEKYDKNRRINDCKDIFLAFRQKFPPDMDLESTLVSMDINLFKYFPGRMDLASVALDKNIEALKDMANFSTSEYETLMTDERCHKVLNTRDPALIVFLRRKHLSGQVAKRYDDLIF